MALGADLLPASKLESEELAMLRDSVDRFADGQGGFEAMRKRQQSPDGYSPETWAAMAEQGWFAAAFAEEVGGLGLGAPALACIMQGLGRGMFTEPVLTSVALAGRALATGGDAAQQERFLAPILSGEKRGTIAYAEPRSRFRPRDCSTRAEKVGDGWRLTGHKSVVLDAPSAEFFIVSARISGDRRDAEGIGLYVVERGADGLRIDPYATMDGRRGGDLHLGGVAVGADVLIGGEGRGGDILEDALDYASVMGGAEAVGAMTAGLSMAIEHLKQREQFGAPLIDNQVLKHRVVENWTAILEARALVDAAARQLDTGPSGSARAAARAAKVWAGRAAQSVGKDCVQLHGAIGTTDEHAVSHHFKRLTALAAMFGGPEVHLERHADALMQTN